MQSTMLTNSNHGKPTNGHCTQVGVHINKCTHDMGLRRQLVVPSEWSLIQIQVWLLWTIHT